MIEFNIILQALLVVTFSTLVIQKKNSARAFTAIAFVIISFLLRFSIDVDTVRDFRPYYESFLTVKYSHIPPEMLIEPYRVILFQTILLFGGEDSLVQIQAVYFIHFLCVTAFFIWLSYLKDVSFVTKLVLFIGFYPPIAFVWVRAGMAYMASCYLIYTFSQGRWRPLHFLLPFIHISTIPLLLVTMIRGFGPYKKALIILVLAPIAFLLLDSSYANYAFNKWNRYSETGAQRDSTGLFVLHMFNIFLFVYLAIINAQFRKNFLVLSMMATYIALYYFNPVMGLRVFPFVLIACIVERILFVRYGYMTLIVVLALLPVYFFRFNQILL